MPASAENICRKFNSLVKRMSRKKYATELYGVSAVPQNGTPYRTIDILFAAIGDMLSGSVLVVNGVIIRLKSGPSAAVSFLICGISALLCALSYADLACRLPRVDGSYRYVYATVGEFVAFTVGWMAISDYIVGCAATAKTISSTVDMFSNFTISSALRHVANLSETKGLSTYPDVIAFGAVFMGVYIVSTGVHMSWQFVAANFVVAVSTVLAVSMLNFVHADGDNMDRKGGFLPYSITGMLSGAGTAFYAFFGVETAIVSTYRIDQSSRSVPTALGTSVVCAACIMALSSLALSLLIPYYDVPQSAPYAAALYKLHYTKLAYASGALSLVVLALALFSQVYMMPRLISYLADDGLVGRSWSSRVDQVEERVTSSLLCGAVSALLALLVDYETLVDMLSVGTLVIFMVVDGAVVALHYTNPSIISTASEPLLLDNASASVSGNCDSAVTAKLPVRKDLLRQLFNDWAARYIPSWVSISPNSASWCLLAFYVLSMAFSLSASYLFEQIADGVWWAILLTVILLIAVVVVKVVFILFRKNQALEESYTVPTILPFISIFLNALLLANLNWKSWIRLVSWTALGTMIYFGYGITHSRAADFDDEVDSPVQRKQRHAPDSEPRYAPMPACAVYK